MGIKRPGNRPKVYIAASSAEIERAKLWRDRLRAAGVDALAGWIESVESAGHPNPTDWKAPARRRVALDCLIEVTDADVVWLLVPPPEISTFGAWLEMGFGYACAKQLVSSGQTKQSVFTALGAEYDTDEEAFTRILASLSLGIGGVA